VNRKGRFENLSAYLMRTHLCIFGPQGAVQILLLLITRRAVDRNNWTICPCTGRDPVRHKINAT